MFGIWSEPQTANPGFVSLDCGNGRSEYCVPDANSGVAIAGAGQEQSGIGREGDSGDQFVAEFSRGTFAACGDIEDLNSAASESKGERSAVGGHGMKSAQIGFWLVAADGPELLSLGNGPG